MTQTLGQTSTQAPTLLVVADLGDTPPLAVVSEYLAALDAICRYAYLLTRAQASGGPAPAGRQASEDVPGASESDGPTDRGQGRDATVYRGVADFGGPDVQDGPERSTTRGDLLKQIIGRLPGGMEGVGHRPVQQVDLFESSVTHSGAVWVTQTGPTFHFARAEATRPDVPVGVASLKLASPLEVVLTTLASETKPFGYALAALYVAKQGLQMVMDWQVHRAELSSRKAGLTTDEVAPGEAGAVGTNVVLEMLQASGTRPAPENYEAQEGAAQAVRVLVRRPLVRVEQGDGQAP